MERLTICSTATSNHVYNTTIKTATYLKALGKLLIDLKLKLLGLALHFRLGQPCHVLIVIIQKALSFAHTSFCEACLF